MSQSHALSALIEKHAEISGFMQELEKRVAQHRADLLHIEATMRLLDTDFNPDTIKPKRTYFRRTRYFKSGELSRLCLIILRNAEASMVIRELATRIMTAKGLDQDDLRTRALIAEQTQAVLRAMSKRGVVARLGAGRGASWKIAD